MIALYGHKFSSYTWKALIPLYANATEFEFRGVGEGSAENDAVVAAASPLGKFPLLVDGEKQIFEATAIIEYLAMHHPGDAPLLPEDADAALETRKMDRVFDNYVMGVMQIVVDEYIRDADAPDQARVAEARAKLERVYDWLDVWLKSYPRPDSISLIECAAAPSLFYADWVHPIGESRPLLAAWRTQLLAMPAVARCVEDARPFRSYFPLGAPDRD